MEYETVNKSQMRKIRRIAKYIMKTASGNELYFSMLIVTRIIKTLRLENLFNFANKQPGEVK